MIDFILGTLRVLITPSCWIQNEFYSADWDAFIQQWLRGELDVKGIDEYSCIIGGVGVWIENHPYASFTPHWRGPKVRPKRITILRAYDKLVQCKYQPKPYLHVVSPILLPFEPKEK